jgi:hypothetical protein
VKGENLYFVLKCLGYRSLVLFITETKKSLFSGAFLYFSRVYLTFFSLEGCNNSRNGFIRKKEGYTKVMREINNIVGRCASKLD